MFVAVLKAINEDSPTVPTLLTDYILKGEWCWKVREAVKSVQYIQKY
jgi:hypothetical protein